MRLNHPELVSEHPAHLVSSVKMSVEKVPKSRSTLTSCEKPLHTLVDLR